MHNLTYTEQVMYFLKNRQLIDINDKLTSDLDDVNELLIQNTLYFSEKLKFANKERDESFKNINNNKNLTEQEREKRIRKTNQSYAYLLTSDQQLKMKKEEKILKKAKDVQKTSMYQLDLFCKNDSFNNLTIEKALSLYKEFEDSINWTELSKDGSYNFSEEFYRKYKHRLNWRYVSQYHNINLKVLLENKIYLQPFLSNVIKNKNTTDNDLFIYFRDNGLI